MGTITLSEVLPEDIGPDHRSGGGEHDVAGTTSSGCFQDCPICACRTAYGFTAVFHTTVLD
eukprot:26999-Prymnesium_polylepis.1